MKERIIFHIDVNNAFLSWHAVLLLKEGYKTDIRMIPAIIGGSEKERRGIVLAKSPIAKKYKIVTAETIYSAKKKCPILKVFPPNYKWYYKKSNELMKYLSNYSPLLEQYSVDECFLDMTGMNYLYNNYIDLAYKIKEEIKQKFGYTVNIGIGNNKLCAKMASDFLKPDKVHTLFNNEIKEKLWPLPVAKLFMVGKKTTEKLNKLNIKTVYDLSRADEKTLYKHFKNQAIYLKEAACGIDNTKVEPRKDTTTSISVSETLSHDEEDPVKLKEILFRQTEEVTRELRYQKQYTNTVAVIFKNNKFINYSAQMKLSNPTDNTKEIYKNIIKVFENNYKEDPIRLIGVRLSGLSSHKDIQLSLFDKDAEKDSSNSEIQKTIDKINEKFGSATIAPASIKKISIERKDKLKSHKYD